MKQLSAFATDLDSKKTVGVTDNPKEKSTVEMDQSWGSADRALAQSHHLEESADWAGGEAKTGVSAVVRETRLLAGKLTVGGECAAGEVDKGFDDLGYAISGLGQKN